MDVEFMYIHFYVMIKNSKKLPFEKFGISGQYRRDMHWNARNEFLIFECLEMKRLQFYANFKEVDDTRQDNLRGIEIC